MDEWIDCEKELPPCDGIYAVTNNPNTLFDLSYLEYDGYGFKHNGHYVIPDYWKERWPRYEEK